MKFLFAFLLLVSLSNLQTCYNSSDYENYEEHEALESRFINLMEDYTVDSINADDYIKRVQMRPNIAVYQQVKDRGDFIVICRFTDLNPMTSLELSVESEHYYSLNLMGCLRGVECLFKVTVSPPASFTCVVKINFEGNILYWRISETYSYSQFGNLDSDHHEKGVSLFYICFVSIIAVCLMIMITAVIVITIMSNSKEPIKADSDYDDAITDLAVP